MARVTLNNISKIYPNGFQALYDTTIDINDEEFIVLVGPSGCGKTTTLRMLAGIEEVTTGDIYIDQVRVNDFHPKDRDISMVFQNYALYPHMNVYDNMAFGLKMRKTPKDEIDQKVRNTAAMLHIENLLHRKPGQLSGGQRQRVALGRAMVRNPKVFLFDEPLSNLDAKLRDTMRTEISRLHTQLGTTMIYVTHDQTEAMSMADRIVVLREGFIQQIDTPVNLYKNPQNMFVAGFIGSPPMNFHELQFHDGAFQAAGVKVTPTNEQMEKLKNYTAKKIIWGLRAEYVNEEPDPANVLVANIEVIEPLGSDTFLYIRLESGINMVIRADRNKEYSTGQQINLGFDVSKTSFFDCDETISESGKIENLIIV